MSNSLGNTRCEFEIALEDFKQNAQLGPDEIKEFRFADLKSLRSTIKQIQAEQEAKRRMRHMRRLEPLLQTMEQYGRTVDVFVNTSEILAFVWVSVRWARKTGRLNCANTHTGTHEVPLESRLFRTLGKSSTLYANICVQTASNYSDALDRLLEAYQIIWGELPLLNSFQELNSGRPYTKTILGWIYHDILEFHREAMKFFRSKGKIPLLSQPVRVEFYVTKSNHSQYGVKCFTQYGEGSSQR